ncbi:MAG: arginine--tRNA ligase [bacterium]
MIKDILTDSIGQALGSLGITAPVITLEHPADLAHGDYSCNVAMMVSKQVGKSPKELAENIKTEIEKNKPAEVEKVEVAGPGFINFYLSEKFFVDSLKEILEEREKYGSSDKLAKQKTIVEYTDPNPFKLFHIGHLMTNAVGETLARTQEFFGAEVKRANYQGDVGLHVAKTVADKVYRNDFTPWATVAEAGASYASASTLYKESEDFQKFTVEINKKLYDKSDSKINELYGAGKKLSLDDFERIYKRLGTKFDFYFFESDMAETGKKLVLEYKDKGIFEESDGAIVFKGEKVDPGLHTRVFVNSEGLPTYEAKELALSKTKHDKYKYDKSIVVTGNEVNAYFDVLLAAMKMIYPELAEKTFHFGHGMLRLPSGKMASRTGDVITAEWLIDESKKVILEKLNESDRKFDDKELLAEQIAVGAVKYSILKQAVGQNFIYDIETSVAFNGNSGPYLQYTYARTCSILEKAGGMKEAKLADAPGAVEKLLYRFPEVVERAATEYAPHYICTYLYELASAFNSFYNDKQIVSDEPESHYRVALTDTVGVVMKNGLTLLGIQTPEKM